jgi:endonuclease-3 related protein
MVGAVLTQNTNWVNVSRAIANLKEAGLLSVDALFTLPTDILAHYIRPAGYYNLKAGRLKNLLALVAQYENGLDGLFAEDTHTLRERLLSVRGIGPETADSIMLYAAGRPVFVVDAYTHRILTRHALIPEEADYYEIQDYFLDQLPADAALFNEYHALLVRLGKDFCNKSKPRCALCPLTDSGVAWVQERA